MLGALLAPELPATYKREMNFLALGTWWIPMLLVLGVWRYVIKRFPLAYDPLYWGAVFPLGMYAVSKHELAAAMRLDFLAWIPRVFFWIALAAWTAAFAGLVLDLARRARSLRA